MLDIQERGPTAPFTVAPPPDVVVRQNQTRARSHQTFRREFIVGLSVDPAPLLEIVGAPPQNVRRHAERVRLGDDAGVNGALIAFPLQVFAPDPDRGHQHVENIAQR